MLSDITAAKEKHSAYLLSLPNVQDLGIGLRMRNGVSTSEMVLRVFVSHKFSVEDLAEHERIPGELEGIPTDVEVMAPLRTY